MVAQSDGTWYQADVEIEGLQLWQPLAGLRAPAAYTAPPA